MLSAAMLHAATGRPPRLAPAGSWTNTFTPCNGQALPARYSAIDVRKGSGLNVALWGSAGQACSGQQGGEGAAIHFTLKTSQALVWVGNNDANMSASIPPATVDGDFSSCGFNRGGPSNASSASGASGGGSTAITDLSGAPIAIAAGGGAGGPNYGTSGWKGGDAGLSDGGGEGGWQYGWSWFALNQAANGSASGGGAGLACGPYGYSAGGPGGGGGSDGSGGGGGGAAHYGTMGGAGGTTGANGGDGTGTDWGTRGFGGYGKNDSNRPGWGGFGGTGGGGGGYGGGGGGAYAYTSGAAGGCLLPAGAIVSKASNDADPNRGGAGSNSAVGQATIAY